jgi:SRSO17 transposase
MPRRTGTRQLVNLEALAQSLPASALQTISWREGTNAPLRSCFAAVRVRRAGGNEGRARLHEEQWLLMEWPAGDPEPVKYYLSNLPEETPLHELVALAHRARLPGAQTGVRPRPL